MFDIFQLDPPNGGGIGLLLLVVVLIDLCLLGSICVGANPEHVVQHPKERNLRDDNETK
jgi:hypothetical protein